MVLVEEKQPIPISETDTPANPSFDELRKMMDSPDAEEEAEKPKPDAKTPDPGTGDVKEPVAEPKPEPVDGLPKGVAKRIAEEVAKTADIERKIAEAVSNRKAKEAELAKLTTDTGSDPAKTPKVDENARPVKPNFKTFEGTGDEFDAAIEKYDADLEAWLENRTSKTVETRLQERQAQEEGARLYAQAAKEHGEKWETAAALMREVSQSMRDAISTSEHWSKIAVYLADNPALQSEIADQFKTNPPGSPGYIKVVAQLGRLEDKITAAPVVVPAKPKQERLPAPLSDVEAPAEQGTGEFNYEAATPAQRRAYLLKGGLLD